MKTQSLKCPYCRKTGHDSLHCYKKMWDKRLGRGKFKAKPVVEPTRINSKAGLAQKMGKLSSAEQNERRKLIKELDRVTSLVVRWSYANKAGKVSCFTCGKLLPVPQIQNGHCFGRRHFNTRWDLSNCRPQCVNCNVYKSGNYAVYLPKLRKELGEERYWKLSRKAHSTQKVTTIEMRELLVEMNRKLQLILEQRKKLSELS